MIHSAYMLNAMCSRPPWAKPEVRKRHGSVSPRAGTKEICRVSPGTTICRR